MKYPLKYLLWYYQILYYVPYYSLIVIQLKTYLGVLIHCTIYRFKMLESKKRGKKEGPEGGPEGGPDGGPDGGP